MKAMRFGSHFICIFSLALCLAGLASVSGEELSSESMVILGQIERVLIKTSGLTLDGRVDTGAELSSIHGENITRFSRNGDEWVRFNLNPDGVDRFLEMPLRSVVRIRQAGSSVIQERPVIVLSVVIGDLRVDADFTLTDRSLMTFPLLIGRNVLEGRALVDVSGIYLQSSKQ
ncbi:hypothetical protein EXM22_12780 [Oceanispirochaeta crateris]|uniref:Retropepsin-like aspartic endopeptidase domain-containing protein n=1 Tax=Oceanispirochaeta crateris TaxID=2518645 RepID=A0A5C1QRW3_9SPIO|nr:RimK/LysX family protein [Oceanispirochaeta crateris]QEN08822.1 hypothetical protein EXM22_12780 [Oceanispirochaeta crateris]